MLRDWGVMRWLADWRPEGGVAPLELLSFPGDLLVIVTVLGLLLLFDLARSIRADDADAPLCSARTWSIVAIVLGGLALIVALESVFGVGRPPAEYHAVEASPYGFPSGHTMAATVCWGAIAWWASAGRPTPRIVGVATLVALVGFSRLALGVHYLVDVLAAVAFGVGYLGLSGRYTLDEPGRAFLVAIAIGTAAVVASVADTRSVIALAGVVGGAIGYRVSEHPRIRRLVRHTASRSR